MYEQIEKSKENNSRSIVNTVAQKKSNLKQGFEFVDNRTEAVHQRKIQEAIITNSSKDNQLTQLQAAIHSQSVIQRLSNEYYNRAVIQYSSRAFAHLSREEVDKYLWDNKSQIVVGQSQTILIGGGLRTGYAVNGNISYNCTYDENSGRHHIFVYHAHAIGRMG